VRRAAIRPVSPRKRRRDAGYAQARRQVFERAEGLCEARCAPSCSGRCEQVHHRAGRGGVDPHRLDNLVGVCQACHMFIEAHRGWAYEAGWLVRRNGGVKG
jgi:5-methylcytosine-specific restriction endonuclease McrA